MAAPASVNGLTFVGWNEPIGCGGVAIFPDDIIVVDDDGAVVIPQDLIEFVAYEGAEHELYESWVFTEVEKGAQLPGLYPPNEEAKARYAGVAQASRLSGRVFFIWSQVLGFLALPSNVLVMLGLVGLALTATRFRRTGHGIVAFAIVLLAIAGIGPLGKALLKPLEERFPPWDPAAMERRPGSSFSAAPSIRISPRCTVRASTTTRTALP